MVRCDKGRTRAVSYSAGIHMTINTAGATVTVALLGNPNTGKSTLFSALVGVPQRIGNYPGVTVEQKLGSTSYGGRQLTVIDLPGTYSLAPRSPDEMVTVDVLLGRLPGVPVPDVIVCIVDASNLERNLYLVSQVLELGRPLLIVLNKMDIASERNVQIDTEELRKRLGVPLVEMQAHRRVGVDELKKALITADSWTPPARPATFPPLFCEEVARLKQSWQQLAGQEIPRYLAERVLLDTSGYLEQVGLAGWDGQLRAEVHAARQRLEQAGSPVPAIETTSRYSWVDDVLRGAVTYPDKQELTITDRIDQVVTSRYGGVLIFALCMITVFQAIFFWARPLQELMEQLVSTAGSWVESALPAGVLQSLLADGVVAGVGAVLVFVPQIAMLFLFVAILEECGYMARAAYLMDGLMSRIGLSGKSFIPLLSSFACAVPGILATRVIENRRDRLVTMLVAPLMSCSARLPVYTLLIAAFVPDRRLLGGWLGLQGITIVALYMLGILVAVCVAKILKVTILKGETPPFVMELPDYRLPSWRVVLGRVVEQCWAFVRSAGTLILAVTVLVWAAAYFPHPTSVEDQARAHFAGQVAQLDAQITAWQAPDLSEDPQQGAELRKLADQRAELEATIDNHVAGAYMQQSFLGQMGKLVAPVVRPLGWDWRIGCAVLASFPAREVVIGAMGVIYNLGEEQDESSTSLKDELIAARWPGSDQPIFTLPVALSIMVFFALCAQCAATLMVIRKETKTLRWPLFTFAYMTCLAYLGALLTYQIGTWLTAT